MYYLTSDDSPAADVASLQDQARTFGELSSPQVLWITCSDSCSNKVLQGTIREESVFSLQWPGNNPPDAESARDAIEYAVQELHVTEIVICGHSYCSTKKAGGEQQGSTTKTSSFINRVKQGQLQTSRARDNVVRQMESIRSYDSVTEAEQEDRLNVHGLFFLAESNLFLAYENGEFVPLLDGNPRRELSGSST